MRRILLLVTVVAVTLGVGGSIASAHHEKGHDEACAEGKEAREKNPNCESYRDDGEAEALGGEDRDTEEPARRSDDVPNSARTVNLACDAAATHAFHSRTCAHARNQAASGDTEAEAARDHAWTTAYPHLVRAYGEYKGARDAAYDDAEQVVLDLHRRRQAAVDAAVQDARRGLATADSLADAAVQDAEDAARGPYQRVTRAVDDPL